MLDVGTHGTRAPAEGAIIIRKRRFWRDGIVIICKLTVDFFKSYKND